MFDASLPFAFVQTRRNKYSESESFNFEYIFKFYRKKEFRLIKYIVSVKEYKGQYLTLDYYPKNKPDTKIQLWFFRKRFKIQNAH